MGGVYAGALGALSCALMAGLVRSTNLDDPINNRVLHVGLPREFGAFFYAAAGVSLAVAIVCATFARRTWRSDRRRLGWGILGCSARHVDSKRPG
jgi:hypothetical protein